MTAEATEVWSVVAVVRDDYGPTQYVVLKKFNDGEDAIAWMDSSEECDLLVQALNDDLTNDQWLDDIHVSSQPPSPTSPNHTVKEL